ncbi:hypothetical protein AN963_02080 [Brevibacillus choshinensis]|uniref:Major facilitator superfamily (MFS) profile domain-containing protein n=1 Tax=Brevibacillus choshinensis TaxID=54911 RepID=A0ABR5NAN1_BRECH|nr:MFS transporter [Brevibacillus choshinensis]KQL48613.1 hypothetical protein AN963_02080 [Brevibacillus choshinensis]
MPTTVLFLMSTMFIANIGFGIILPTLPFLSRQVGASTFELGLALSAFAIAQLLFSSFWGGMSDRVGKRPILILGIVGYGVTSALVGLSPNVVVLLLLRFLSGALCSAVMPASLSLAANATTPEMRPRVMAYMGSVNGIGFIVGPPLGAVLSVFGLQVPFVSVGILSIVNGIVALWLLPKESPRPVGDEQTKLSFRGFLQIKHNLRAFFDRSLTPFLGGTFAFTLADATVTSTLAFFLTDTLHSTQAMAGWAFMVNGGVGALIQVAMFSAMYQRWGEKATIVTGFSFGALGYLTLGLSTSVVWVFVAITLLAFCRGFAFPAMTSAISLRTTVHSQGSSFGSQMTFNSLGRTIGPLIAGWLFAYQERFPYFFACGLLVATVLFIRVGLKGKLSARAEQA